jgi:hypothetical protein
MALERLLPALLLPTLINELLDGLLARELCSFDPCTNNNKEKIL